MELYLDVELEGLRGKNGDLLPEDQPYCTVGLAKGEVTGEQRETPRAPAAVGGENLDTRLAGRG